MMAQDALSYKIIRPPCPKIIHYKRNSAVKPTICFSSGAYVFTWIQNPKQTLTSHPYLTFFPSNAINLPFKQQKVKGKT
jgi:hypothetical protein